MNTIGERINHFRRKADMTQEMLGNIVGVSMQAVSKWENGGVPDPLLLPAIADALGVSIDALFGRNSAAGDIDSAIAGEVFDGAPCMQRALDLLFIMHRASFGEESYEREDTLALFRDCHSQYIHENGLSLMQLNEKLDYAFIAPRPQGGFGSAVIDKDVQIKFFSLLGQPDAFDVLIFLHAHGDSPFTLGYLCRQTGVSEQRAQELLGIFEGYGLVIENRVMLDDSEVAQYTTHKNPALVPLLAFSLELIRRPNVFNYYRADNDSLL